MKTFKREITFDNKKYEVSSIADLTKDGNCLFLELRNGETISWIPDTNELRINSIYKFLKIDLRVYSANKLLRPDVSAFYQYLTENSASIFNTDRITFDENENQGCPILKLYFNDDLQTRISFHTTDINYVSDFLRNPIKPYRPHKQLILRISISQIGLKAKICKCNSITAAMDFISKNMPDIYKPNWIK